MNLACSTGAVDVVDSFLARTFLFLLSNLTFPSDAATLNEASKHSNTPLHAGLLICI